MVWLIDFAKSIPLPDNVSVTHKKPWVEGSHEDGYLIGLDNIIKLMTNLDAQQKLNKNNGIPADKPATQVSDADALSQVKNSMTKIQTLQNDVLKSKLENLQAHKNSSDSFSNTSVTSKMQSAKHESSDHRNSSISATTILTENERNTANLSETSSIRKVPMTS